MSQQQSEILEICHFINQQLDIDQREFSFEILKQSTWYLTILQVVFPYLAEKLHKVKKFKEPKDQIDTMLFILAQEEIIQRDFLDIKGINIINGDCQSIYYIVQLIHALIDRELCQQNQQQQEIQSQSSKKCPKYEIPKNQQKLQQPNFYLLDSKSKSQDKQRHSVLGINNQFQSQQVQQHQSQRQQDKPSQNSQQKKYNFNVYNAPLTNSYPPAQQQQRTYDEDSDGPYLKQKLKQYKSNQKPKKSSKKKKMLSPQVLSSPTSHAKKLVTHPTIKKQYRKASNPQAQKLTDIVKKIVKMSKIKKQKNPNSQLKKPVESQLKKKQRELQYYTKNYKSNLNLAASHKRQSHNNKKKDQQRFLKTLKWQQQQLKKQKKQFQKALQLKLQIKKQKYVKTMNKLILELERKKNIQEEKIFKENLILENREAEKRMIGLQKWYKDRFDMLKQKRSQKQEQRELMHTGHKQIIKTIERDLKKENQQKMIKLAMKYRKHQAEIQNDLQELTEKIVKVYKKN